MRSKVVSEAKLLQLGGRKSECGGVGSGERSGVGSGEWGLGGSVVAGSDAKDRLSRQNLPTLPYLSP